jgi:hypothetical protein
VRSGPLGQGRIFDNLALDPPGLTLQHVAQGLQLGDELLDLLHRGSGRPLQHDVDVETNIDGTPIKFTSIPEGGS